jgi:hypothetical protein
MCWAVVAGVVLLSGAPSAAEPSDDVFVASYYFPNYHVDPRNEARHGKGWTEWRLLEHARPRFDGHDQPKRPLWGYTDEADPAAMAQKIDAAADHGVDAFIFDWYYYDDGPFLERGIERGFFGAPNNNRLKFGVMWANHDWVDIQPAKLRTPPPLQFPGKITAETWERMTTFLVETYFAHPSYWMVDGKPYFSVYDLTTLLASFGGVGETRAALDAFRAKCVAAGLPGLHLNAVVWGNAILPVEQVPADPAGIVEALGFDSVTSYVWIHHVALPEFPQTPFEYVRDKYLDYARGAMADLPVPYFPNITMGWDSSPRACATDIFELWMYPFMATIGGNTPDAFEEGCRRVKALLDERPGAPRIVTVNCWNEWTEGSYLEPDEANGYGYLEALRRVFAE